MNKYIVRGLYTISFEMEVEADSRDEAEEKANDLNFETEHTGNSVFCNEATLSADGTPRDIEVELIEGEEESEDDFEEED